MLRLDDAAILCATDGLSVAELDGEAVVLSTLTGTYYGLNEVGARALELVATPQTFGDVVRALASEFDVAEPTLRADLAVFFEQMNAQQLVRLGAA